MLFPGEGENSRSRMYRRGTIRRHQEDEEEEEEERKRKKEPGRRRRRRPGYVSAFFPRWHGYSKNWVEYPWRSFLKPAFRFDPGHSAGKRSSSTN